MNELNYPKRSGGELISSQVFVSSRYRSEDEVIYDVLNAIRHGTHTGTRLMFSAYLSYGEVDKSLRLPVAKELISEERPGMYGITETGLSTLDDG